MFRVSVDFRHGLGTYDAEGRFETITHAEGWLSGRAWRDDVYAARIITDFGVVRRNGTRHAGVWHWSTV